MPDDNAAIEAELLDFEAQERKRLGLDETDNHWRDANPKRFARVRRDQITVLFGGLTGLHDALVEAALAGLGYRAKALPCPDSESLQAGKEFGNRAQCNPTYFTVGNLLKYITRLRDEEGMEATDIVNNHVFLTVGGCGPCRFGTYITEYRKALRDAGFKGLPVFDIRDMGQQKNNPGAAGLELNAKFGIAFFKCILAGDIINALGYRIRPYERVAGAADKALEQCKEILCAALEGRRSVMHALYRCRKILARVEVDHQLRKPKVSVIGEFWAMTTEGEGNYRLQRFLEAEGAECETQMITTWAAYELWEMQFDTRQRMALRRSERGKHEKESDKPLRTLAILWTIRGLLEKLFGLWAWIAGLRHFHLPNMEHLAAIAHEYYPVQLRGGEGHMEVGKVIDTFARKKAHLVISVKPFGCMPSSGVSDGVQSMVTAKFPEANFCAIETSGDGAVSVYSRIQMALFKARARAKEEYEQALSECGGEAAPGRKATSYAYYPRHVVAGTAANAVLEAGGNR